MSLLAGPNVTRASIIFVSHFGQGGLLGMTQPLDQAGAQHSQSPVDTEFEAVIVKCKIYDRQKASRFFGPVLRVRYWPASI